MFWKKIGLQATTAKRAGSLSAFLLLTACATNIQPMDATQTPPSAAFGQFTPVLLKPLTNQTPQDFPPEAAAQVQRGLEKCLSETLGAVGAYSEEAAKSNPTALVLEPTILNGKKVSVGARIWLGALAGSSAVQMQVTYKSAKDDTVLAQPVFYAKAAAMSGAWTFGAQDNAMLDRLSENACQYTATYKTAAN
ncbi:hypothetical protein [Radicibacter daui]|uniref:hypothetical protein n=1 Tax=Radicibacter daui TaxID=3064829 RepID=UPI004046B742